MTPQTPHRDDNGFSFVQLIVTMVISGILLGTVGFAAFSYIGQARETVLEANIRTAADAVQNTLALNPNLRVAADPDGSGSDTEAAAQARGAASPALLSALSNAAGFTWVTPGATPASNDADGWRFAATDTPEVVHIQMLEKDAFGTITAAGNTGTHEAITPDVRWLVDDRDAVRLQVRNEDGAWACALVVLRPDWNGTAADADTDAEIPSDQAQATVEGNLRGIWYDAGANIPADNGLHHCSPTLSGSAQDLQGADYGNTAAEDDEAILNNNPLPVSGSTWNIPAEGTAVLARTFLRSVPDFESA